MEDSKHARAPRRRKLINPPLQLKLVGSFVGMSALALMVQFLLLGERLSKLANQLPGDGTELSMAIPGLLLQVSLLSLFILLPLTGLIGVLITHRVAGPLYRFGRHLEAAAKGEETGPCAIRSGDELQEFCKTLNAGLEGAYQRGLRDGAQGREGNESQVEESLRNAA